MSILILKRRFVDIGMPQSAVCAKGRYKLIVRDAWGTAKRETPWFDNIILDAGLNRWGTGTIITGAAIGTGTSTPLATQTALDTESTFTTTSGTGHNVLSILGSSPYNNTRTFVYRTTLGALNGNYSEVGVGWASGSMFSRALILDGVGSPTTISVSNSEQLDIVYQLSVYPPLVDTGPTSVSIGGVSYSVTGRAAVVNSGGSVGWVVSQSAVSAGVTTTAAYSGAIGAITAQPSGTSATTSTFSVDAYSNNSNQRTASTTFSLTQGNVAGGIRSVHFYWNGLASFQYDFGASIPKDGTKTLVLNFSVDWARRP